MGSERVSTLNFLYGAIELFFSHGLALRSSRVLQPVTQRVGRNTFLIAFEEKFCADHAIGSDNERAGVWDTFKTFGRFPVKNAVGLDGFAADI